MTTTVSQVALVVSDIFRARIFYAAALDLDDIFGTTAFCGKAAAAIQGLPNPSSTARWLTDDRPLFQLELFQFDAPKSRPLPADGGLLRQGYNRLLVAVRRLEHIDMALTENGFAQRLNILDGPEYRCARLVDPDGVRIELIELPELVSGPRNTKLIGLELSCADLQTTREDFVKGFGFFDADRSWPLPDERVSDPAETAHTTLQLDDFYLRITQRADSQPRSVDYRLSDIGIMNFALGYDDQKAFEAQVSLTAALGLKPNCPPQVSPGKIGGVYNNTREGYSVEMLFCDQSQKGVWGFAEPTLEDREAAYQSTLYSRSKYVPTTG